MVFYITEIDSLCGYCYQQNGLTLSWSLEGLVIGEMQGQCVINDIPYAGGVTVPWADLKKGNNTLTYRQETIIIYLKEPADEKAWSRFLKKGFPGEVRLAAYGAYFGARYARLLLDHALTEDFFLTVLAAYKEIGLGSGNPYVLEQVGYWHQRFMKYLSGKLLNADCENNPGAVSQTITRIHDLCTE